MASRSAPTNSPAPRRRWAGTTAPFEIPDDVLAAWRNVGKQGASANADWLGRFEAKPEALRSEFMRRVIDRKRPRWARRRDPQAEGKARRRAADGRHPQGQRNGARRAGAAIMPELLLGSADLTPSNNTRTKGLKEVAARRFQRPLHPLRHPRDGHGGGHERDVGPWRIRAGRRHLPVLHRLCAALRCGSRRCRTRRWSTS